MQTSNRSSLSPLKLEMVTVSILWMLHPTSRPHLRGKQEHLCELINITLSLVCTTRQLVDTMTLPIDLTHMHDTIIMHSHTFGGHADLMARKAQFEELVSCIWQKEVKKGTVEVFYTWGMYFPLTAWHKIWVHGIVMETN